jgi:hypothetical protein
MRILFVENKHVTRTWEAVTPLLMREGDDVHWLVQNRRWTPGVGTVHQIPIPGRGDLRDPEPGRFQRIRDQDRGINYFGGDDRHYTFYAERIAALVDAVRPDVVIGEATLFHEHLAMEAARARRIPYLFPTSVRYPVNRIGFLAADTQIPVLGSGDVLPRADVDELLAIYAQRGQVPLFYTALGETRLLNRAWGAVRALSKGLTATRSRFAGERFNTPSPLHKARIERRKAALMRDWDRLAAAKRAHGRTRILFPLQMLPESTLECWGHEWRDQHDVLERLVAASDDDTVFLVKTNPVPRYEITRPLLDFVARHPRVQPLPSATKMDEVFWDADLVATVTGTVAIEAFLAGKPFVTLGYCLATPFAPGQTLIRPEGLPDTIAALRSGTWPVAGELERRRFLEHQIAASHKAVMGDVYYYPPVVQPENLRALASAYGFVRRAVQEGRAWEEFSAALARNCQPPDAIRAAGP